MTPATSPSVISRTAAPVERTPEIMSAWRARSSTSAVIAEGSTPLALARRRMLSAGEASSSTTPLAQPGPPAIFCMYTRGRPFRKGPNNTLDATATDVGSPWAIGAAEGGHTAVHPELGTVEDVRK